MKKSFTFIISINYICERVIPTSIFWSLDLGDLALRGMASYIDLCRKAQMYPIAQPSRIVRWVFLAYSVILPYHPVKPHALKRTW